MDESNHSHNTISSRIKIHYKFHPYCDEELEIESKPRTPTGTYTVIDREGKRLKVPLWMTNEQSSQYHIEKIASIDIDSMFRLQSFIDIHFKNSNP